jgi:hypothetical protein
MLQQDGFQTTILKSLNISIGTKKVFDQKANMIIYVRGIDLPNQTVHVTIVRESSTKYRAVCKIPVLRRVITR